MAILDSDIRNEKKLFKTEISIVIIIIIINPVKKFFFLSLYVKKTITKTKSNRSGLRGECEEEEEEGRSDGGVIGMRLMKEKER